MASYWVFIWVFAWDYWGGVWGVGEVAGRLGIVFLKTTVQFPRKLL